MPSVALYVGARLTDLTDVLTSQVVSKKYNQDTGVPYEHVEERRALTLKTLGGEYKAPSDAAKAAADAVGRVAFTHPFRFSASPYDLQDHIGEKDGRPTFCPESYWLVGCDVRHAAGSDMYYHTKAYDPDAVAALVSDARAAFKIAFGFDVPVFVVADRGESSDD